MKAIRAIMVCAAAIFMGTTAQAITVDGYYDSAYGAPKSTVS